MKNLKNRVQLIGHLGSDPKIKEYDKGKKASFSLATNDVYTTRQGKKIEDTQWHHIAIWGNLVDVAEKYLKKGSALALEGKLTHRSYESDTGDKRHITEINVSHFTMLGKL